MKLRDLFEREGTDKVKHGYDQVYECLFRARRMTVQNILEVGVGTLDPDAPSTMLGRAAEHYRPGGSLRAWRHYFPNAQITGMDVKADAMVKDGFYIRSVRADSTDGAQVILSHLGLFDIIIDDGSHYWAHQMATLHNLWSHLGAGGVYVIEDIIKPEAYYGDQLREIVGDVPLFFVTPRTIAMAVVMKL